MRAPAIVLLAASATLLTGCSTPETHRIGELPGLAFDRAEPLIPDEPTLLVQDVSVLVDEEPMYDGSQFGSDLWTIVAACADAVEVERATSVEIAVLPTAAVTSEVEAAIHDGEYSDTVTCEDATASGRRNANGAGATAPAPCEVHPPIRR